MLSSQPKRSRMIRLVGCILTCFLLCQPVMAPLWASTPQGNVHRLHVQRPMQSATGITQHRLEQILSDFLGSGEDNRHDRTSFTSKDAVTPGGEQLAAEWLQRTLESYGFSDRGSRGGAGKFCTVQKQEFAQEIAVSSSWLSGKKQTYLSQNIVAKVQYAAEGTSEREQVILSAHYDNTFGDIFETRKGTGAQGALDNGTGVAVLLALAEYFAAQSVDIGFDIVFLFFGGEEAGYYGSHAYVREMKQTEIDRTLLMVNLDRLGCDRTYLYADEVKTGHSEYMMRIGAQSGNAFDELPKTIPLLPYETEYGLSYSHFGMVGSHAAFFAEDINVLYIWGADYSGFHIGDNESNRHLYNLSRTDNDTLKGLVAYFPDYLNKMEQTARTVVRALETEGFSLAMRQSKSQTYDYGWLTQNAAAWLILLSFLAVVILVLILLFSRKKRDGASPKKQYKVAVFGTDYEEQTEDDVFLDFTRRPRRDDAENRELPGQYRLPDEPDPCAAATGSDPEDIENRGQEESVEKKKSGPGEKK